MLESPCFKKATSLIIFYGRAMTSEVEEVRHEQMMPNEERAESIELGLRGRKSLYWKVRRIKYGYGGKYGGMRGTRQLALDRSPYFIAFSVQCPPHLSVLFKLNNCRPPIQTTASSMERN